MDTVPANFLDRDEVQSLLPRLDAAARDTLLRSLDSVDDPQIALWQAWDGVLSTNERHVLDFAALLAPSHAEPNWLADMLRRVIGLPQAGPMGMRDAAADAVDSMIDAGLLLQAALPAKRVMLEPSHHKWRDDRLTVSEALNKTLSNALLLYLRDRATPTPKNAARPFGPNEFVSIVENVKYIATHGAPMSGLSIGIAIAKQIREAERPLDPIEPMLAPLLNPPLLADDADAKALHAKGMREMCEALRTQKRFDEAQHWLDRAAAIRRRLQGEETSDYGFILQSQALISAGREDWPAAEQSLWRAMSLHRKLLGPDHIAVWEAHVLLATFYYHQKKHAQGLEQMQAAAEVKATAHMNDRHIETQCSLTEILAMRCDQPQIAVEAGQRATQLIEERYAPDDLKVAQRYFIHAKSLAKVGKTREARERLEHALQIRLKQPDQNRIALAATLSDLSMVCGQLSDYTAAIPYLQQSIEMHQSLPAPSNRTLAINYLALAALRYQLRDLDAANELNAVAAVYARELPATDSVHRTIANAVRFRYPPGWRFGMSEEP